MAIKTRAQASQYYADKALKEYKKASSFGGMTKETIKGMPKAGVKVAKTIKKGANSLADYVTTPTTKKQKKYYRPATVAQIKILTGK